MNEKSNQGQETATEESDRDAASEITVTKVESMLHGANRRL